VVASERVVLGTGQYLGISWELAIEREANQVHDTWLMLRWGSQAAGTGLAETPVTIGSMSVDPFGPDGLLIFFGEIGSEFERAEIQCLSGPTVSGNVTETNTEAGRRAFVALLPDLPARVTVTRPDGHSVSRDLELD